MNIDCVSTRQNLYIVKKWIVLFRKTVYAEKYHYKLDVQSYFESVARYSG